jgi:hypothetical protein
MRILSARPSSHEASLLLGSDGRDGMSPPLALRRLKEWGGKDLKQKTPRLCARSGRIGVDAVIVVPLDENGRSCPGWE